MDPDERQQRYDEQTEELYAGFGRFAVQFEHLCNTMRQCLMFALHGAGLRNQELARILLADLTAYPLKTRLLSTVAELEGEGSEGAETVARVLKRVQDLIERRNDVIHATWYIGWASEQDTDFSEVKSAKDKLTRKGVKVYSDQHTRADFDDLTAEAKELTEAVNRLLGCIAAGYDMAENMSQYA